MKTDVRIIECERFPPLKVLYQISQVDYSDTGEIIGVSSIEQFDTMEEALAFCDKVYQATFKPVLIKDTKGDYL
jgi:hypothetical protein